MPASIWNPGSPTLIVDPALRTDLAGNTGASLVTYLPSGVGGIASTLQSIFRETVSVKRFGAVSDGNITTGAGTDNTTKIQAAINAVALAGYGAVYVPAGIYKVSGQITIPSGIRLYGDGPYMSVLLAPTAFNSDGLLKLNGVGGVPTVVENIGILGQTGGAGAVSVGINSIVNGVFIKNVWVSAFKTNVILGSSDNFLLDSAIETTLASGTGVSVTSTDVTVANCVLYDCYVSLAVSGVNYLDGTVTITGNRSIACSYIGFLVSLSSNVQISNCSVGHNNSGRYSFAGIFIDTSSHVTVTGFIGRLGGTASLAAYGVYVNASNYVSVQGSKLTGWLDGIYATAGYSNSISGNQCQQNGRRGIYALAGDMVSINANVCISNGTAAVTDAGIYSNNSAGFAQHSIVGNMCTQSGGVQEYGIYANLVNNGASSGVTNIVGNMNNQNALVNLQTAGLVANINLSGNY